MGWPCLEQIGGGNRLSLKPGTRRGGLKAPSVLKPLILTNAELVTGGAEGYLFATYPPGCGEPKPKRP
jgi:hypothetical protein